MAGKTRIGSHQNFDPSLLVATQKTLTDFREDEASTQKKSFSKTQILNILHQTFRKNSFLLILAVNSPYLRPDNHIGWVKPTPLHQWILFIQGLIPEILIYVHLLHDINSPIPQFTNPRFLLCLLSRCVWLLLFRLCNTNAIFFLFVVWWTTFRVLSKSSHIFEREKTSSCTFFSFVIPTKIF